jgi:hypothetical protein
MSSVVGDCGELLSLDQGLFMVAWRNPFGLASHPQCSAPHESSRDSFQLCRACSSSMASAIVERTVVGVIESRGAVVCLGCSVVSGMGVGGQILGGCQTCQAKFDARMELVEVHCTITVVAERVAGILRFAPQSSGSVALVASRPGLALRHADTLVGAPFIGRA